MLDVRLYYLSRIHFIWDYLNSEDFEDITISAELMELRYLLKNSNCILDNDLLRRIWDVEEEFHKILLEDDDEEYGLWQTLKKKLICMRF